MPSHVRPAVRGLLALLVGAAILAGQPERVETAPPLTFAVLNQRSPQITAQYWNPILAHVSRASGISLELRMGKTAPETTAMTVRGDFDFAYTNHLFTPERAALGFRVIARPANAGIRGALVTLEHSDVRSLADLAGRTVVFPSREAFAGYRVPLDALVRASVDVNAVFAGNQDGAMAQLAAGAATAASVNATVMQDYARREGLRFRVIWTSDVYLDLPIMAHPRVSGPAADAVRAALVDMSHDPEGQRILAASAAVIKQSPPLGFVGADDRDYANYRRFYRQTVVKQP